MEEATTQLADTRPVLDTPLRVAIPVNVPQRNPNMKRDANIYSTTFSPMAINQSHHRFYHSYYKDHQFQSQKSSSFDEDTSVSMFTPPNNEKFKNVTEKIQFDKLPLPSTNDSSSENKLPEIQGKDPFGSMKYDANIKNLLNDYLVLSVSSKRANKKDVEAMAYASLGVLYDNQNEYVTANAYYQQYLSICDELQDVIGVSAAYNCIGMNYMLLVNPLLEKSDVFKNYLTSLHAGHSIDVFSQLQDTAFIKKNSEENPKHEKYFHLMKYVQLAIQAHQAHLEKCPDLGGKFIANVNLGIGFHWMNSLHQSAFHFQDALRIAIKMQTLFGQSIAVGNLGLLALHKKDFHTARTCFDQVRKSIT
jgi:hypothetical protein